MHPIVNIAMRAALEAGELMVRAAERLDSVRFSEKSQNDFVSEIDQKAEAVIIKHLRRTYPDHAILAEESGATGQSDYVWIIDPLDGTTNYLRGLPHYAISIALSVRGRIEHGLVYDPLRQELFTASRGEGARLNDRRIRVGERKSLEGAILATALPFRQRQHLDPYMASFNAVFADCGDIRRTGSAALDLAYVAAGRLDGYWELGLKPWDIAAGMLLVQESGGMSSDFKGSNGSLDNGQIVAGNPRVFKALLQKVHGPFA